MWPKISAHVRRESGLIARGPPPRNRAGIVFSEFAPRPCMAIGRPVRPSRSTASEYSPGLAHLQTKSNLPRPCFIFTKRVRTSDRLRQAFPNALMRLFTDAPDAQQTQDIANQDRTKGGDQMLLNRFSISSAVFAKGAALKLGQAWCGRLEEVPSRGTGGSRSPNGHPWSG